MNAKTNTELETRFFDAVKSGDVGTVRKCIAEDRELLQAYDYKSFGATPLTAVVFKDDREMIDVLLELGADPNRRSDWGMGPWSFVLCCENCDRGVKNFSVYSPRYCLWTASPVREQYDQELSEPARGQTTLPAKSQVEPDSLQDKSN